MEKAINQDIDDIDIKSEVIKHFKVGEKYTGQYTKIQLGVIYDSCGYKKNPKATDIKVFFEVKKVLIPIPGTKKRSRGFKIISAKT